MAHGEDGSLLKVIWSSRKNKPAVRGKVSPAGGVTVSIIVPAEGAVRHVCAITLNRPLWLLTLPSVTVIRSW